MLGLSDQDISMLLSELDRGSDEWDGVEHRSKDRHVYTYQLEVVSVAHGGTSSGSHLVLGRNLSEIGFGFLQNGPVALGTPCTILLKTLDDVLEQVDGTVSRCRNVCYQIHDIGVRFDGPIDLVKFIKLNTAGA